jgi:hypothetical protein
LLESGNGHKALYKSMLTAAFRHAILPVSSDCASLEESQN